MSLPSSEHALGLEQIPSGEEAAIAKLIEIERELLQRKIDHDKLPAPGRPVPRGQHPKHHGVVRAEFAIADDLPEALRFGLFRDGGKRFPRLDPVLERAHVLDDRHPGGHGMAIKLMGVPGDKLLPGEEHAGTHDFLLLDSPVFFIKNAIEFAHFDATLLATEKSWFGALSLAGYLGTHIPEALILRKIESNVSTNPLETEYWSAVPYKLGAGAVKYFARPRPGGPPIGAETPSVDQLHDAMKRNLDARDATFDFFVQRHVDAVNTPIEDATHKWDESVSPYEKVATIHIPRQTFDSAAQMAFCQNLAYNPWHALADHRPLGGLNRARKAVYRAISAMRHALNKVDYQEPTPETAPAG